MMNHANLGLLHVYLDLSVMLLTCLGMYIIAHEAGHDEMCNDAETILYSSMHVVIDLSSWFS